MFFGIGSKWRKWKPTDEYLSTVSKLDTITKLQELMSKFVYKWDTLKLLLWNVLWDSWKMPDQSLKEMQGDCLEENTTIITKDGFKKIKDININDLVLSYNFDLEKYEYKKVINKWDKGILDGYIINLRNGHNIIATGEHRFFCRIDQKNKKKYEIKKLDDIDISRWWKRQIYSVYKIPCGEINVDKNLAYIYGIYLAEGYGGDNHICIAQDKINIRKKIENALDNLNVPYSKSKREIHAFYNILKCNLKEDLKKLGSNSFNKNIPMEFLNWDKESLKSLIEGILDGDGTDRAKSWNNGNDLWEFSTSSEQVAKMFNIICRKVYGNCWFYKQEHHQGVGKEPIYRLRYNPNGKSNREIFNDISCVVIKSLGEIKNKHYYDIEIEDNHNFILADSGVISHNCEDAAILALDVLGRRQSWTKPQLLLFFGYYTDSNNKRKLQGHAVTAYKSNVYDNTYSIFSNNEVEHNFTDLLSIGHRFYPLGLKYQEIRDWRGNVLSRKFKLFGTF